MADAVHAFAVYCRLVRGDHTWKKRLRVRLPTYALRSFMYTEIVSYAVACTVAEITLGTPERHTRKGIKLMSCSAAREYRHRKVNHTLQYKRIVFHFKVCTFSHRDCTGDVSGAGEVLSAGIHEIKAARFNHCRAFARS